MLANWKYAHTLIIIAVALVAASHAVSPYLHGTISIVNSAILDALLAVMAALGVITPSAASSQEKK